ncbi:hypothetical protein FB451DRAFT_1182661 [Mycena latifolia]|nr:hypothetical protein FB451DRAFT_1182661 [Mycena latifolia]
MTPRLVLYRRFCGVSSVTRLRLFPSGTSLPAWCCEADAASAFRSAPAFCPVGPPTPSSHFSPLPRLRLLPASGLETRPAFHSFLPLPSAVSFAQCRCPKLLPRRVSGGGGARSTTRSRRTAGTGVGARACRPMSSAGSGDYSPYLPNGRRHASALLDLHAHEPRRPPELSDPNALAGLACRSSRTPPQTPHGGEKRRSRTSHGSTSGPAANRVRMRDALAWASLCWHLEHLDKTIDFSDVPALDLGDSGSIMDLEAFGFHPLPPTHPLEPQQCRPKPHSSATRGTAQTKSGRQHIESQASWRADSALMTTHSHSPPHETQSAHRMPRAQECPRIPLRAFGRRGRRAREDSEQAPQAATSRIGGVRVSNTRTEARASAFVALPQSPSERGRARLEHSCRGACTFIAPGFPCQRGRAADVGSVRACDARLALHCVTGTCSISVPSVSLHLVPNVSGTRPHPPQRLDLPTFNCLATRVARASQNMAAVGTLECTRELRRLEFKGRAPRVNPYCNTSR